MSAFLASWTGQAVTNAAEEPDGERMLEVLNLTGARRMPNAIGVWPDLDGPELRAAIRWSGHTLPIVPLDGPSIAERYRQRDCPSRARGEPLAAWLDRARSARTRKDRV